MSCLSAAWLLAFSPPVRLQTRCRAHGRAALVSMDSPVDLLMAAAEGDVAAALEAAALAVTGSLAASTAWSLVQNEQDTSQPEALSRQPAADDKFAIDVDLGDDGEPPGICRLLFKPLLPRSELLQLQLRVPLGLLIEESSASTIVVTGALPEFSAISQVEPGDLVRGITAYREVISGAPMWQQVTSGTPMGTRQLKRLVFRCDEGAGYGDVRDAIASHREGNGVVTLLVERAVNASTPLKPRAAPRLESLQSVLARDLSLPAGAGADAALDGLSPAERARRLLGSDEEDG